MSREARSIAAACYVAVLVSFKHNITPKNSILIVPTHTHPGRYAVAKTLENKIKLALLYLFTSVIISLLLLSIYIINFHFFVHL